MIVVSKKKQFQVQVTELLLGYDVDPDINTVGVAKVWCHQNRPRAPKGSRIVFQSSIFGCKLAVCYIVSGRGNAPFEIGFGFSWVFE